MKKKILLIIPLFLILLNLSDVYAKDIALKYPMNVSYIGCTSYTYTCTGGEIPSVQYYVDNDGLKISEQFFVNNNYIGFGGNGDTVRIRVQLTDYLVKGQKYSISFIMGAYEDDVNIGNYFRSTQYFGNGYSEYNQTSISHYLYSTDDFKVDFGALHIINYVFTATANTSYFNFILESVGQYNLYLPIYGYTLTAVDNAIDLSGVATQESLNSVQSTLNVMEDNIDEFNATQEETNDKLDDMQNTDLDSSDKELPSDEGFNDYTDTEGELIEKVEQADMSVIDIGIDATTSNWIWDTLTSLIQSHTLIFTMFISILSIGVIKLVLGR